MLGSGPLSPRTAQLARAYTTWLNWWRSTIDSEDYLKYASREVSSQAGLRNYRCLKFTSEEGSCF